jgi:hypothetical protein
MQRSLGNRATQRLIATGGPPPTVQRRGGIRGWGRRKNMKNVTNGAGLNVEDLSKTEAGDAIEEGGAGASEGLGVTSNLTQVPSDALGSYGATDSDRPSLNIGSDSSRTNLTVASDPLAAMGSGLGAVGGLAGGIAGIFAFKSLIGGDSKERWEAARVMADLVGAPGQVLFGGVSAGAAGVKSVADGVASTGSDAAQSVADASGGVMSAFGSFAGFTEGAIAGAKGVIGAAEFVASINKQGWAQGERLQQVGTDFLKSIKGFLGAAQSAISSCSTFLSIAKVAGDAVAVMPIIGSALSIAANVFDILIQGVEIASRVYTMVKNILRKVALAKLRTANAAKNELIDHLIEIAQKRWKRTIVPLVSNTINILADFLSIGGAVLNIVGVATAAAYGAGGALMAAGYAATATAGVAKIGAAALKPGAAVVRTTKQWLRNGHDADETAKTTKRGKWFARQRKAAAAKLKMNAGKTTTAKDKRLAGTISDLLGHIHALPALPATGDPPAPLKAQYENASTLLKATGVNTRELFATTDGATAVKLLAEALRKRD